MRRTSLTKVKRVTMTKKQVMMRGAKTMVKSTQKAKVKARRAEKKTPKKRVEKRW